MKLPDKECPSFFIPYLSIVNEDLWAELNNQLESYSKFILSIPKDKELFRYAPNKWTVKEVIGHNTDTERIKLTSALRIARLDTSPISGFDEDKYVLATDFNSRSMIDLVNEFMSVRKSSISLYKSLKEEELVRIGQVSGKNTSVRALFYFLVGHIRHHKNLLKERYEV